MTADAAPSRTLNLAYTAVDMSPDPAVYYGGLGNDVELGLYEGLTKYGQDSSTPEPDLARSWTISPNGLTYTFHLRPNVTFHDGTPFNSTAAKFSFEREIKIDSAPAYMLSDVASMSTPGPLTFVVHLKKRNSVFLSYQASAYGPKFVSPTAVRAHLGSDNGQTWLKTHDAGTGPYTLSSLSLTSGYVLKAYPKYWGHKPYYTTVDISVVPNNTTEVLELERGQLDLLSNDISSNVVKQFSGKAGYTVRQYPTFDKVLGYVNPSRPDILSNKAIRLALQQAINKNLVVSQAYGTTAQVSSSFYAGSLLPRGMGLDKRTYDPAILKNLVAKTKLNKHIVIMEEAGGGAQSQMAELIQAELQADGVAASLKVYSSAETLSLSKHPNLQPDIRVDQSGPDAGSPASVAQTELMKSAPLNMTALDVPAADAAINAGIAARSVEQADADYAKAAEAYIASGEAFPIADNNVSVIARGNIKHIVHNIGDPYGIVLDELAP